MRWKHAAASAQYKARVELMEQTEAAWRMDAWSPLHALQTCKAWRAVVLQV